MDIEIVIAGITPLLMNRFSTDEYESKVKEKNLTPRESAAKKLYVDNENKLHYPTQNIYASIMNAGKFHKDGKNKLTTQRSSLIPSGVQIMDEYVYFDIPDEWEVDSRGVVVPSTGGRIICHRPRLDKWQLTFWLSLDTTIFSPKLIRTLLDDAGSKVGLGDFRPERKGIFGRFVVACWHEEDSQKEAHKEVVVAPSKTSIKTRLKNTKKALK